MEIRIQMPKEIRDKKLKSPRSSGQWTGGLLGEIENKAEVEIST